MNKVILMGRLTRDPVISYSQGKNVMAIAKYTLAVNRNRRNNGEEEADYINCTAFNKAAEFAEKYLRQGTKIAITGRIQTGSYTNKEGKMVYTTVVIVDEQEFAESKSVNSGYNKVQSSQAIGDDLMENPAGLDETLPFN